MSRVEKAIASGRCALAVSGSLLRDAEVMLALTERSGLSPMALAGPAVAPVLGVGAEGIARAVAEPGGLLLLVEPEAADAPAVLQIGQLLARGRHKPEILVVARSFNPFQFGAAFNGLKVSHEKGRGKAFIQSLPMPPAAAAAPAAEDAVAKVKKASGSNAPRFLFVGRDEELATLTGLLAEGGPIALTGPDGVGRTWLAEHAIAAAGLERVPDVRLGWASGFDTLAARLATVAAEAGDRRLLDALAAEHTPAGIVELAIEVLSAEALSKKVLVVHALEFAAGREGDFFRKGQLELLVIGLLTATYAMKIVFIGTKQPTFYREGQGTSLRRMTLGGVKGRFLHDIFESYKAPEFPREKFGPIQERIFGHPFAARILAVLTRVRSDGLALIDDPKFLKMDTDGDLDPLNKQLAKRIEKLPPPERECLARIAHVRSPLDANQLQEIEVDRKTRSELQAAGLLDMVGTDQTKLYAVHPLVRAQLSWRELNDFDTYGKLAEWFHNRASKVSGAAAAALLQEQTRCAMGARAPKLRPRTEFPDHDPVLDTCYAMIRSKEARLDIAEQRLAEVLNQNPYNADAHLLKLELLQKAGAPAEVQDAAFEEAMQKAPTPETLQSTVSGLLGRRARNRAIEILEKGILLFSEEPRLKTRLASLLLRAGRRNEAIDLLKQAMIDAPMLPDAYGLLGQAKAEEGAESSAEAEVLLREAVRLAPEDAVQASRLAELLLARARVDQDAAPALREEAKGLLDESLKRTRFAPESQLMLARLLRESGGDLERADWLLKQVRKDTDRGHDRWRRLQLEKALVDAAAGRFDEAETTIRQQIGKDPAWGAAFGALGQVLEAREQFIPAHGEYVRAKERTPQNSLAAKHYEQLQMRVQAIIEAQAAGLWTRPAPVDDDAVPMPAGTTNAGKVLRRRGESHEADAAPAEVEATPVDDSIAPESIEASAGESGEQPA